MWDDTDMPRKPLGPVAMTETVKFRCTTEELECLRRQAEGENISTVIRAMINKDCR